jgi:hypothetical protein
MKNISYPKDFFSFKKGVMLTDDAIQALINSTLFRLKQEIQVQENPKSLSATTATGCILIVIIAYKNDANNYDFHIYVSDSYSGKTIYNEQ